MLVNKYSIEIEAYGYISSCFETEDNEYIICFYLHSLVDSQYKIIIFDKNLTKIDPELIITSNIINEYFFFKCIFYEGNKGIFIYYDTIEEEGPYAKVLFRQKIEDEIREWDNLNEVQISSYIFETHINLNDIIKLSNNFICFSSISTNKDILYIVMLNIFEEQSKVKIRYYLMRTYDLYHYKFYLDLRLNTYKNFIALTSSYCNQEQCGEEDTHYSSLIIFNYPNSTDYSKNITDELFEKNEIIENLVFNLSLRNNVFIENNIFGFVYSKIIVKTLENCDPINLMSSTKNSKINNNYELENNEDINVSFNNYNYFNCTIGYVYGITEPNYVAYEQFAMKKDIISEDDNEEIFNEQKKIYTGRLSYYNLYLKDNLTKDCDENCTLCDSEKKCIVCDYHFEIISDREKNCLDKKNEETEKISELSTDKSTGRITDITDIQTDILTNKPTEKISEKYTDIISGKPSNKNTDISSEKKNR